MVKNPFISIVIPAHNEEKYLPRCLESLKNQQQAPNYEVIVVDNASNDETAKIAKSYGATVIYEPTKGVQFAREAGRRTARGKVIISTDADSFFKPNWLNYIEKFFKNNPDATGLAGHYYFYKGPLWSIIFPTMGAVLIWMIYKITHKVIYASAANLAYIATNFSGYDTRYYQGSDERGLIKELQQKGRVHVTLANPVFTSSRRINQGFWHSIIITIGYYYTYNAWATKLTGKSRIGAMPIVRDDTWYAHWRLVIAQWFIVVLFGLVLFWIFI